jgi:divalent anion:Na+ symporter, DASS family
LASAKAYGREPDDGAARKIGTFLMRAAFQGNVVTRAMFMTAMVANPFAANLAAGMHIDFSCGESALAAAVPGVTSLVLIPLTLYKVYPPEIKETPGASQLIGALIVLSDFTPDATLSHVWAHLRSSYFRTTP